MSSRRRVVITGLGAITPLGHSIVQTWQQILAAKSGIGKITHFDASGFPSQIAGEVKQFDFEPWIRQNPKLEASMSNTRFAIVACDEAVRDSGLDWQKLDPYRTGIYYAAGDGGSDIEDLARAFKLSENAAQEFDIHKYNEALLRFGTCIRDNEKEPSSTLKHLVERYPVQGPAYNCLTACAASAQAIGEALEMIRRGETDVMLSGGAHSMIHPFGVTGFCLLTTLSTMNDDPAHASRPFDRTRHGFVLSEGAGAVILEEYEHAKKRNAKIYGELIGYGSTADAYRLTDSHPEGEGASHAIEYALADANVKPEQIEYINAHGTSTKVNDMVETLAIKKALKEHAYTIGVSSTKSMTGHLIAAAGVVELEFCLLAMRDKILPPTINYQNPDPECDLDYIPNTPRQKAIQCAMSNSFGFGGQNVVLIVRKDLS